MFKVIYEEPYFTGTGRAIGSLSWQIVEATERLDSADIRVILGKVGVAGTYETLEAAIAHVGKSSAHVGVTAPAYVTILSETMTLTEFRQGHGKAERDAYLKGLKGTAARNWLGEGFNIPDDEAITRAEAKGWIYPW